MLAIGHRVSSMGHRPRLLGRGECGVRYWVYLLRCVDGSYYTGCTGNLDLRLGEHQAGEGGRYTAARRPVALMFSQECGSREEALARECQI